jgi:acetylornithine deacetylase/succinyl-diaminopimelate desuccinylase-like protein
VALQISFVSVDRDTREFNTRIRITTKGKSAHAAYPGSGDSAVAKIVSLLRFLRDSKISMKLYSLQGGSDINKIPDTGEVSIVIPDLQLDQFRRKFKAYLVDHPQDYFELKFGGTGSEGVRLFPEELIDAIFFADDLVSSMDRQLKEAENPEFSPPYSTVAVNSIVHEKDAITLSLHFSLLPEASTIGARKELETKIQSEIERISQGFRRLSLRFKRVLAAPPMYTDESSTFVQGLMGALVRSGIPAKVATSSACSEGAFFSERGIATVAFGPGRAAGNSHSADEANDLAQMDAAVRFYSQVIDSFCHRGI